MRSASVRSLPVTDTSPTRASSGAWTVESAPGMGMPCASESRGMTSGGTVTTGVESPRAAAGDGASPAPLAARGDANDTTPSQTLSARSAGLGQSRNRRRGDVLEHELLILARDPDPAPGDEVTAEDEFREWIFEVLLDRSLERTGPEGTIEALVDEQLDGLGGEIELDLLGAQPTLDLAEQDAHDLSHVVARERVEHDGVIDTVQELRVERALELIL